MTFFIWRTIFLDFPSPYASTESHVISNVEQIYVTIIATHWSNREVDPGDTTVITAKFCLVVPCDKTGLHVRNNGTCQQLNSEQMSTNKAIVFTWKSFNHNYKKTVNKKMTEDSEIQNIQRQSRLTRVEILSSHKQVTKQRKIKRVYLYCTKIWTWIFNFLSMFVELCTFYNILCGYNW